MTAQKITKEVIENLPNSDYAIFRGNVLVSFISIYNDRENQIDSLDLYFQVDYESGTTYIRLKNFLNTFKDDYIILASEIKLNSFEEAFNARLRIGKEETENYWNP